MSNLALPGNPRYQPASLVPFFGYDKLASPTVEVEIAVMRTLAEMGVFAPADMALLTPEIEAKLLSITTTAVDEIEKVTKHDVRALVRLMQEILPEPLRRWVHIPLTSYDALDTARTLSFLRAHQKVVMPQTRRLIETLRDKVKECADIPQVGRTHGQHALPITVGFWLATILSRVIYNAQQMDIFACGLRGKISGAVGAYNAQVGLGLYRDKGGKLFEDKVLTRLGLQPGPISTQILPPEPLSYYLFACTAMSASLGQLGRDCRHLMRTEIAELAEPFAKGQVGSSTMAHKRNPINFEKLDGMWDCVQADFAKVLALMVSEHQRDLTGSSVARGLPVIIVNLVVQLETLIKGGKDAKTFLERVVIDLDSCERNLKMQGDVILAEPLYIVLQMAGYAGDAHELVNHVVVEHARAKGVSLMEALEEVKQSDIAIDAAWGAIPEHVRELLRHPTRYVGNAKEKALDICALADGYLKRTYI